MTTSGTAAWTPDLVEIAEEVFERCGSELRSGYDLRTFRRSMNALLTEWASKGLNLWTLESGSIPLVAGTATYNLPADTIDLLEHTTRTGSASSQSDIALTRISVSTYATIPNKNATGRPLQIFVERLNTPRVTLWPVPDASTPYTMVYWRMRRIQDAGDGTNTPDMPFRFLPALCVPHGPENYRSAGSPADSGKAVRGCLRHRCSGGPRQVGCPVRTS